MHEEPTRKRVGRRGLLLNVALIVPMAWLLACAHRPQARIDLKPEFGFEGPREMTVIAEQEDFDRIESALKANGFVVRRWLEGASAPKTEFVARLDGVCGVSGVVKPTLHVDIFKTDRRVFEAAATSPGGCPDAFLTETVATLSELWRPAGATSTAP